jgi:hypothetical protein
MPRYRSELPQRRRHTWIYDEDWAWLEQRHPGIDVGPQIREIIHAYVQQNTVTPDERD